MVTKSSRRTTRWRVLQKHHIGVFYHSFNTFSVCCNDFLTCCWVFVACCLNLVCCCNTLRRVLLEKQHTDVSWLQKAKFLEHVSVSYKHVCVLKQHANNTSSFLVYIVFQCISTLTYTVWNTAATGIKYVLIESFESAEWFWKLLNSIWACRSSYF